MNKWIVFIGGVFLSACTTEPPTAKLEVEKGYDKLIDVTSEIVEPKHYVVYQTTSEVDIDGQNLEEDWGNAAYTTSFIDIEGEKKPKYNTQVKMLWDKKYLYVYAKLEEPHIWGDIKEHDAIIFRNNDFEVFIDPTDDTYNYTEIEVNALNATWDLRLNKSYRLQGHANDYYEIDGLKTAVHIDGSLNDASDVDRYWAVEMAIPLEVLLQRKRKALKHPKDGDCWRINFSRVQWEHDLKKGVYSLKKVDGKRLSEYNWVWSNQGVINMHLPERWGYLEFSENMVGNEKPPKEISNVLDKQVAYALLQQIKFGEHKELLDLEPVTSRRLIPLNVKEELFNALFLKTHLGFEIMIENIRSKERFVINEEGKFKLL